MVRGPRTPDGLRRIVVVFGTGRLACRASIQDAGAKRRECLHQIKPRGDRALQYIGMF
ncbi:hypothetical protein GALL_180830 [mine drainage metagenome]|uniref:Uncharacterized protein n=1 Tax=mine drainage metagenome TaxID=410659 RepID=A0A1J5S6M0_9ZZZZ